MTDIYTQRCILAYVQVKLGTLIRNDGVTIFLQETTFCNYYTDKFTRLNFIFLEETTLNYFTELTNRFSVLTHLNPHALYIYMWLSHSPEEKMEVKDCEKGKLDAHKCGIGTKSGM